MGESIVECADEPSYVVVLTLGCAQYAPHLAGLREFRVALMVGHPAGVTGDAAGETLQPLVQLAPEDLGLPSVGYLSGGHRCVVRTRERCVHRRHRNRTGPASQRIRRRCAETA